MSLKDYIVESAAVNRDAVHGTCSVIVKDPLPDGFDLWAVLDAMEDLIPAELMLNVEQIIIGYFDFLEEKSIVAAFKDGAIYVLNSQVSEGDLLDDLVHEVSHAIEEEFGQHIYGDMKIVGEYLAKKRILMYQLESAGFEIPQGFGSTEYEKEVDDFLYKEVGYSTLRSFSDSMFINPYSITSIREYWGVGFENYVLEKEASRSYIKNMCPALFSKLREVFE
jgi:hypothetical protein